MPDIASRLAAGLADRYRLDRELGAGGMATVYLARDLKHDRPVAVKLLRPELAAALGAERFLREIAIAAQLLHPHVLSLIDSGETDRLLYYVMPYVGDESLRLRLNRVGELPLDDGLRILRDVVDALAYAHQQGIVHRDIKPDNILISGRHALVTDFGIAKAISDAIGTRPLTLTGLALGTPAYMAPEQAAGDPQLDHRADIYAIGVLAYEMFAGSPPFTAPTAQEMMAAHLTQTAEPLAKRRPSVPTGLERVVMRCLEKRAADRWQSSDELLRQLENVFVSASESSSTTVTVSEPVDRTFRLSEKVCRKLNRATLDPRIIGQPLHYLDNQVRSHILLCFVHACGLDQREFTELLQVSRYRALAPTLYGFEPTARRRIPLPLDDHAIIIREFLADAIQRLRPTTCILIGFSSGADFGFRVLSLPAFEVDARIAGFLSLGCNVSRQTCFLTGFLARLGAEDQQGILRDLGAVTAGMRSLDDWVTLHEYLVQIFRKFRGDIDLLRRFAEEIVLPFVSSGENPFVTWYRTASQRVSHLRCVFEDTDMYNEALRDIRLKNLDEGILGPHYRDDSIATETVSHFELLQPERVFRHVESMLAAML